MTLHAETYWLQRFAADRQALEQRRQAGLSQAERSAQVLQEHWPQLSGLWVHGSLLGSGFKEHSDLDLLVQGLPADQLLKAIALAEAAGPLPVDLKRLEDLPAELAERLLRHGKALLAGAQIAQAPLESGCHGGDAT
ncbi:nucleotidyltransferase domain-containing protein [Synechococcus sp. 1G10]|uniref:nucleotidyltransferase domain-containing protein n=1 Tax=Synechococcus sp. 1G10 TaxID=2025605 RepID=UPI000B995C8C|nr:nucleotidyltransferase domain-containing protein [Synechococcus sp. 1G10]